MYNTTPRQLKFLNTKYALLTCTVNVAICSMTSLVKFSTWTGEEVLLSESCSIFFHCKSNSYLNRLGKI